MNWDSFNPEKVFDKVTGKCIGTIQPRMTQIQIRASVGIQGWSAPKTETRTQGELS